MASLYFAVHISFENTNAIFLDQEKCRKYVDEQVQKNIGTYPEWKMYIGKEGIPFEAEILEFRKPLSKQFW